MNEVFADVGRWGAVFFYSLTYRMSELPEITMKLMRLPEVMAKTGLGRSAIYERIAEGTFPKPVALGGRAVAWVSDEIEAWIMARIEERDAVQE